MPRMQRTVVRQMPAWCQAVVIVMLVSGTWAQTNPCTNVGENQVYAREPTYLPQEGLCLVPIQNAKDWVQAQATCEQNGGSLHRLPDSGQLTPHPRVDQCLAAMATQQQGSDDFWIGAVSAWSKHWFWVNGTLLNPIRYTTTTRRAFETSQSVFEVCSRYLSVDYCVSVCHDDASAYTVIHQQKSYPCCLCSSRLDQSLVNRSTDSYLNPDSSSYYIVASREGSGITILLVGSETFSETETLCAVVDTNTATQRSLLSQTCFSESPYLCTLGNDPTTPCDSTSCDSVRCRFRVGDQCVLRDSRPMTWFMARSQCKAAGGDLWTVNKLDDMFQVSRYLQTDTLYWVGATDHYWSFSAESDIFGKNDPDYEQVRCAHMFLERSGDSAQARQWKWADTRCDQQKSYICQFEQTIYTAAETNAEVICPWPIPDDSTPTTPRAVVNGNGSVNPPVPAPAAPATTGDDTYPIVPIIAACIAALVILLCAILMLGYSRRKKWLAKKWRRTRDYMWPFWASTPTYLAPDHTSDPGFDSLSTGHTGMHSDTGSVFASGAFVFPDSAHHSDSSAHKHHVHSYRTGSKEGSKRNESFDKSTKDRLQSRSGSLGMGGASSSLGMVGGGASLGMVGGGASLGMGGASASGAGRVNGRSASLGGLGLETGGGVASVTGRRFSEEHAMSTSYTTLSSRARAREYMTLAARMDILDDAGDAPNPRAPRKPEVALVTNEVDLNFTVNHAYARSQDSHHGSDRSSERGLDEIDMPVGSTVQIPTRAVESVMHF